MMLAAVTVVAVVLCVAIRRQQPDGLSAERRRASVTYPFRAAGSAVGGWFQLHQPAIRDGGSPAARRIEELRKENAELKEACCVRPRPTARRTSGCGTCMNLRQQRRDFTFEAARVIERSTSNWSRTLTLNKGTGLRRGRRRLRGGSSTAIWWEWSSGGGRSTGAP